MSAVLPRAATAPVATVRALWRRWWQSRLPRTDTLLLTQRNVYILPTRAGLAFAITLLVLLLASINYQLNLGYVLTFLLAGSAVVAMHITHNTLRTLTLRLRPPAPVFAGDAALLEIVLSSPTHARFGVGLRVLGATWDTLSWTDVPAMGQASARVSFVPAQRGVHELPALSVETRFPLGLFRAWAIWRPAAVLLVYPAPEKPPAPLPSPLPQPGGPQRGRRVDGGEVEGVRSYRRGDPPKLVYWKKAAKSLASGGELVSRETAGSVQQQLWLDWQACGTLAPEQRLARLAAWVLAAQRAGVEYGLRLPGAAAIEPAEGDTQRRRCLEALALWQ
ncbi:MAG: DUF58 domain-containing protein [Piscinibacter sp.]|uniref:DUF58 domain-containing protein n=1 Tax=Piscinibacter sp. TaxID=1903157 RepID=UPI002584C5EA|nr:DUF58 domain-containing protein [Piscinibacter sp.]MCW5663368.1 DUF58 domain-containing protein [Piscinibacter sp.]